MDRHSAGSDEVREQTKGWTLYWFDRNSRAHVYDVLELDQPIERLLAEYDEDPTCIFKG